MCKSISIAPAHASLLVALLAASLAFLLADPGFAGAADDKALRRTATASSVAGPRFEAANAVDGSRKTRWSSRRLRGQHWTVDLGRARKVDTVKIAWGRTYASRYRVATSRDGSRYSTVAKVTLSSPKVKTTRFASRAARYVRIVGVRRATKRGISFWDVHVYGRADGRRAGTPAATTQVAPIPAPSLPSPTIRRVLWEGDMEEGSLADWTAGSGGYDGCWANGGATCGVSTAVARTGQYSAALTSANNGTKASGARLGKTQAGASPPLPTEAYYSTWYYMPQRVSAPDWWNIFQWKFHGSAPGSDPTYTVNVANRADGSMYLRLYRHVGNAGRYNGAGSGFVASAPSNLDIPVGRWWQLDCLYGYATTPTGRVTCWQNGVQVWDLQNVITQYTIGTPMDGRPFQWTIANYSGNTTPGTQTIYADDARIEAP